MVLAYFWQTGDGYRAGQFVRFTSLFDQESPEAFSPRPPQPSARSGPQP
jgi:hypothetical protein